MSIEDLYELQELDKTISRAQARLASLDARIKDKSALQTLEKRLESLQQLLRDAERQRKACELDAGSTRQQLQTLERRMYSGEVTNPREVESMGEKQKLLHAELSEQEDKLLEMMSAQDEAEKALAAVSVEMKLASQKWEQNNAASIKECESEIANLQSLQTERAMKVKPIPSDELSIYERLSTSKKGEAVSRIERGLCGACRVSLPTHLVQRARTGREQVLCPSCGRLLYVS
jgi:predicted  nucleic acid-binding Zn-ribbon protein